LQTRQDHAAEAVGGFLRSGPAAARGRGRPRAAAGGAGLQGRGRRSRAPSSSPLAARPGQRPHRTRGLLDEAFGGEPG